MRDRIKLSCMILVFIVFAISHIGYASPNMICGQVKSIIDEKPVQDVLIKIENSGFVAKTDSSGKFVLDYAPGEFRVMFKKIGFFPHSVSLNISQKSYFPLEVTLLNPVPKVVDMYGKPVQGASLLFKKEYEGAIPSNEVTNSEGIYTLDYLNGSFQVLFKKEGFRTDGYDFNLQEKRYPKINIFVLCPVKFGLYVNDMYFPQTTMTFKVAPNDPHPGGGFYVPRIKGTWEGKYFLYDSPPVIHTASSPISFYLFPETQGRLGPGGDAFESGHTIHLLKVSSGGQVADFGRDGGTFDKIDCDFVPILERVAYFSGGLASQQYNIYKLNLNLEPGRYAFCQFEKPPLHKFFFPDKKAYFFQVEKGSGTESSGSSAVSQTQADSLISYHQGIVGKWEGEGCQSSGSCWTIAIHILPFDQNGSEIPKGTIEYPSLKCKANLEFLRWENNKAVFVERYFQKGNCVPDGILHLEPKGKDVLSYVWAYPNGEIEAITDVKRIE